MPLTPTPGFLTTITAPFNASDVLLTPTAQVVAFHPSTGAGNFIIYIYYRVNTETKLDLQLLWTSPAGPQTMAVVPSQQRGVGDFMIAPIYINIAASSTIYLAGSAATTNAIYVSTTIVSPLSVTIPPVLSLLPTDVSGLQSWLRSDLGVSTSGSRVTTWADQSGNSNGAFDPATIGPTFNSSGSLNSHPCFHFDGTKCLQWNLTLAGAKSVFMVVKENGSPTASLSSLYYSIVGNTTTGSNMGLIQVWSGYAYTFGQVMLTYGDLTASPTPYVVFGGTSSLTQVGHIFYQNWNGIAPGVPDNYKVAIDTINRTPAAVHDSFRTVTETAGTLSSIGANLVAGPTSSSNMQDDLYEVIVYNKALNIAEQIGLNNYLATRYGL